MGFAREPAAAALAQCGGADADRAAGILLAARQAEEDAAPAQARALAAAELAAAAQASPEPEPQPEPPATVVALLELADLSHHAAAVATAGYIHLSDLVEADEAELKDAAAEVQMKRPETRRFIKAVATLRDPATAAGGGTVGGGDGSAKAAAPAQTTESHGKRVVAADAADAGSDYDLVFSNKTAWDQLCLDTRSQLTPLGVRVWQQRTDIPKDSDNCKHTHTNATTCL